MIKIDSIRDAVNSVIVGSILVDSNYYVIKELGPLLNNSKVCYKICIYEKQEFREGQRFNLSGEQNKANPLMKIWVYEEEIIIDFCIGNVSWSERIYNSITTTDFDKIVSLIDEKLSYAYKKRKIKY